jgi:tape measure domain-containing protein
LALPAFTERGLQVLDNSLKLNESNLRIEQALNGERARGVRFLEKQSAEEARQVELGILGQRSNRLRGVNAVTGGPFPVEGPIPLSQFGRGTAAASTSRGVGNRLGGAVSGSIIGGAFPLLFGQGGGAAAGGAIGGLVGGLTGPGGSFAGSLLGTLLGDIASRGQAVKQLGEDLGFSAEQTRTLSAAFKTANTDVEKFTAVIQNIRGVGLELEEQATAVQLVTALTEKYGGSFEKVGNAVTSALESGKVSQAVLNQLTSQGITVQDALAEKYDVSRDKILDMAKNGEISVQSLLDTLVELGNEATTAAEKTQTPFEKALATTGNLFQDFWREVQSIFAGISSNGVEAATSLLNVFNTLLQEVLFPIGRVLARIAALFIDVVATGARAAADLITGFRGVASAIGDAVMNVINMVPGLRTVVGLARQLIQGVSGRKSSDWNDMPWPEGIPKPGSAGMIGRITAPSQAMPTGGAGRTKKAQERKSRVPELQIELDLAQKILAIDTRIAEAKDKGNKTTEYALEMDKVLEERSAAIAKINLQDIPTGEKNLQIQIATVDANGKIRDIMAERSRASKEAVGDAEKALNNSQKEIDAIQQKRDREAEYADLIKNGVLPANAENYLQTRDLVQEALKSAEAAIIEAEARGASADEVQRLRKELEKISGQGQTEIDKALSPKAGDTLDNAITKAKGELNELIDLENQVVAAADAISSSFAEAFSGLVSGAMTGQEALASFFQGVGDHFMDMAAEMIAKLIEIYILQTVLGFITGSSGASSASSPAFSTAVAAEGAYWPGGFEAFADGGVVTSPTMGLIGEGGEPEYVIPASKMRGAMSRYASGARGSSVIPSSGETGTAQGGGTAVAAPIDVRYTVERINSVDYVTADQFQAGMQQAAAQGAIQGEQLAMRKLQQSASTRNRLGLK